MLKVIKEKNGELLEIHLQGVLNEEFDFQKKIGTVLPRHIRVNCRDITRINSEGVKNWVRFFGWHRMNGTEITFVECSVSFVELLNYVGNFSCGGKIESIYLPFICGSCGREYVALEQMQGITERVRSLKGHRELCGSCGQMACVEDIPNDYLIFVDRVSI
jgi:hypothetical protein